ncbi:ribosomal protein L5 [Rhizoctonia solani AG-3 Rhs1AP]|uniref:Ribosomal protein L5 n=1 Tax=Rhizoctonia solani AG-3 Rhs1AP TaxID=1086054 RepID=X8JJF2_9AGAM|nr:ribosomal protein L5 [Rhizoctonia solani AG-3 Rhs1AP]
MTNPYAKNRPPPSPRGNRPLQSSGQPTTVENLPRLERVVLHTMIKDAITNKTHLLGPMMALRAISGQTDRGGGQLAHQGVRVCYSRPAAAAFRLRPGAPISLKVELRGPQMYEFINTLVEFVLPRLREFRGVSMPPASSSKSSPSAMAGVVAFGLPKEAFALFPQLEVNLDSYPRMCGMHVQFVTNLKGRDAQQRARALVSGFQIPFVRANLTISSFHPLTAMSKLIDSHVSTKQAKLAIDALLKHHEKHQAEKEESELLGAKEEVIWLNVAVKKAYPEKKLKPFSIPLARPIIDPRTTSICLITKDPQREYKDLLEAQNVKFISRVVGVTKLKGKFKPFEARRQLMQDHGIFLVDERVVPIMPKLLGKIFFKAKKQPVPVNLQKKDVKAELERAVSSTYMHQNQGTCTSIKIAHTTFTSPQVLENLTTALPEIVKHIKGGWENVQSLHIKTSGSVALPIWSCDLGSRWDGLGPVEQASASEDNESDSEEEERRNRRLRRKTGRSGPLLRLLLGQQAKRPRRQLRLPKSRLPQRPRRLPRTYPRSRRNQNK